MKPEHGSSFPQSAWGERKWDPVSSGKVESAELVRRKYIPVLAVPGLQGVPDSLSECSGGELNLAAPLVETELAPEWG